MRRQTGSDTDTLTTEQTTSWAKELQNSMEYVPRCVFVCVLVSGGSSYTCDDQEVCQSVPGRSWSIEHQAKMMIVCIDEKKMKPEGKCEIMLGGKR